MPIGIFDSGIGGLTVFKAIAAQFPHADLHYLGDTARVPYGNKSPETIIRYSKECADFLIQKCGVEAIVIACNSASSHALNTLKSHVNIPVIGVVNPGAQRAVQVTTSNNIAVIGTQATIKSESYIEAIHRFGHDHIQVTQKACPLFVPIVEEGIIDHQIARQIITHYLGDILNEHIDTLVLGCTHYPVLRQTIQSLYPDIDIVDSSDVIIDHLTNHDIPKMETGLRNINVTDMSPAFEKLKQLLVGNITVTPVSLDEICCL